MRKIITAGSLIFFIAVGCELVVDIDVPRKSPMLTLNSFFTQDSLWSAKICLDRHIYDSVHFEDVDDATISIFRDGSQVATLINKGSGLYEALSEKPIIGNEYEIRAESKQHGIVWAKSVLPFTIPITHSEVFIGNENSNHLATFNFTFKDPGEQRNYYSILLLSRNDYVNSNQEPVVIKRNQFIYSTDPVFSNNYYQKIEDYLDEKGVPIVPQRLELIFDDHRFDGQEITLQIKTNSIIVTQEENTRFFLQLRTLNEDYYKYRITSELQLNVSNDPLAQPVQVYNNIVKGRGIFAGYSENVYEVFR